MCHTLWLSLQASISQLKELVRAFSAVTPIPVDPFRQVTMTIEAVLRHHTSVGSSVYRSLQGGVEDQGISVIIQSQVFSNLTMLSSGHGSAYSRDPATGETISKVGMRGVYHSRAEGGDEVLPGSRELSLFKELRMLQPALYNDLVRAVQKVEQDFAAVVRVDFLVENGQAYVIHATPMLTLTPQAAMRAVVDYTEEDPERDTPPPLSHRDAVRRVDLQKVPSGEHELWTSDTNARKVLRWAKHMRQDLSCPDVLTEVRSMHDMHKGVQLFADSFGVVHLEDVLGSYFSEELVDVASPAKTAGERALALHSLRINLAGEIFSFLDNASKARVGGGWPRMDVDSGAGAGETESVAVAGQVLRSPASSAADSDSKRAAGCECDPCECNPCECTSTGRPCEHMPSVTIMLCEETRGHEATPAFLHPDFLQMQAHAATEAVLKAAAGMCLSCDKEVVPPHGEIQPCKAELNLAVPFGLGPVELDQCLAHAQAGVTAAEEDFDLQTIGSIIDDIPACAAGATVRRAKDRLVVHFGVGISSPHGCFCTRAIASQRRVDFMVLDLDELTACALGNRLHPEQGPADCSPGPATCPGPDVGKTDAGYRVRRDQAMEAMMKRRLLPCDPYKSIDTSCVLPMVAKSAQSAHKAALVLGKQVKILVSGAPSHDPSSLALLAGSIDAVIVPPAHLPVPLFAAAALGRDQNMGKYGTGGHLHSSSLPSAPSSIDKAPVDTGVMSPVKGAISSMFQSAKSGMRDLFQEEEEPFYFIA